MGRPASMTALFIAGDSKIWWMRYRDSSGSRRLESTKTEDWDEAQRRRLQRQSQLEVVRRGEQMLFQDWVASSWRTTPSPRSAQKTHEANERDMNHLKAVFGKWRLIRRWRNGEYRLLRTIPR